MSTQHPVALIGFMTAGKSSIGPQLGMRIGLDFLDLDLALAEQEGAGIEDLFTSRGEEEFRRLESRLLERVLSGPARVLSTGGGIVGDRENRRRLARNSTVVWLDVRFETVLDRLRVNQESARPLVDRLGPEGLRELHHRRRPLYASCADLRVDADRDAPGRLARRIALHLQRMARA
jgi:shikimate kinase